MKSGKKKETICAGELTDFLSNFDEEMPVYVYIGFNRYVVRTLESHGDFLMIKLGDVSNVAGLQNFEDFEEEDDRPLIA